MTREEYIEIRKSQSVSLSDLYGALKTNCDFKFKNYSEFERGFNAISNLGFGFDQQLFKEYVRIMDIKFQVSTLYSENGKQLLVR